MSALLTQPAVITAGTVLTLRGLTLASRFLLSILLARMLSPEDFGQYGLITAVIAFGLLGVGLEFYSYTLREIAAASPAKRTQIIADQITLGASVLTVIGVLTLGAVAISLVSIKSALWLVGLLAVEHLSLEATRILTILSRPVRAYIVVFLRGGIWVYLISIVMYSDLSARTLDTVLGWWVLGGGLSIGFAAISLSDLPWHTIKNYRPDWPWISNGLRIARPFILTAAGALTMSYVDRFIIDCAVGREALGVYTFYSTILIGIQSLGTSLSQQFLPKVISGYAEGPAAYRAVLRSFVVSIVVLAGGMVGLIGVTIAQVVDVLNAPGYSASIAVLYLMLPGVFLRIVADVPSYSLYAAHADNQLLVCNLSAAIVSVVLNLALVPAFGLYGAALSGGIASAFLLISLIISTKRTIRDDE